ncbi:MAG: HIT family protein [Rickettsiales bacterium]|nr:HIT family protein [Rickettsiales bacterium]
MFALNQKLAADTFLVCDLKISRLLLMNDANYFWFILVPRKADLVELTDLSFAEQTEVLGEINLVAKILKEDFGAQKLNIAALGNVVKQLHIHVIGRFENDATFPKPVWGNAPTKPYEEQAALDLIAKVKLKITN